MDLVRQNPTSREVMLEAVSQDGKLLAHAAEELKKDRVVCLTAVKQNGDALRWVAAELRTDREIALAAVKQKGVVLDAAYQFKGDREVVLAAVRQQGWALRYAADELRGDREVVRAAVQRNRSALQFASKQLREEGLDELMRESVEARPHTHGLIGDEQSSTDEAVAVEVAVVSVPETEAEGDVSIKNLSPPDEAVAAEVAEVSVPDAEAKGDVHDTDEPIADDKGPPAEPIAVQVAEVSVPATETKGDWDIKSLNEVLRQMSFLVCFPCPPLATVLDSCKAVLDAAGKARKNRKQFRQLIKDLKCIEKLLRKIAKDPSWKGSCGDSVTDFVQGLELAQELYSGRRWFRESAHADFY